MDMYLVAYGEKTFTWNVHEVSFGEAQTTENSSG